MVGWGKTAEFSLKSGRHFSLSEVGRVRQSGMGNEGEAEHWLSCVFRWVEEVVAGFPGVDRRAVDVRDGGGCGLWRTGIKGCRGRGRGLVGWLVGRHARVR